MEIESTDGFIIATRMHDNKETRYLLICDNNPLVKAEALDLKASSTNPVIESAVGDTKDIAIHKLLIKLGERFPDHKIVHQPLDNP